MSKKTSYSAPTKCFSCSIHNAMVRLADGWRCSVPSCGRVYAARLYRIQPETTKQKRERLMAKVAS